MEKGLLNNLARRYLRTLRIRHQDRPSFGLCLDEPLLDSSKGRPERIVTYPDITPTPYNARLLCSLHGAPWLVGSRIAL